jgi:hypothetical protein
MSTAANGVPSASSAATVRARSRSAALGRALHEEDDLVLGDRLLDRVADLLLDVLMDLRFGSVTRDSAWIGPPISAPKTA